VAGGKPWLECEDDLLRARYPIDGRAVAIPGRSESSIISRASVLGIRYEPGLGQRITNAGLNPDEWEADQAWVKDAGLSARLRRKQFDFGKVLSGIKPWPQPKISRPKKRTGRLLEVAEVDSHFGKLAWEPESHADYDQKIADDTHRAAAEDFAGRLAGQTFDRVLLLGGQDSLHIANPEGTTSKGTQMDFDGRFTKIVQSRIAYEVWRIGLWRQFGPVTYVSSPGNHSYVAEFMLCEVMKAYFRGVKDVTFMDEPRDRQYLQFGSVGLGFSHGDKTKPKKAFECFASEAPEIWGATKYREFHTGHLHAETVTTYGGMTHRVLKALCAADKWHRDMGYIAMPGTQAFVWDKDAGLVESLNRHG